MAMDGIKAVRIPQQITPPSPAHCLIYLYAYAHLQTTHMPSHFITNILRY